MRTSLDDRRLVVLGGLATLACACGNAVSTTGEPGSDGGPGDSGSGTDGGSVGRDGGRDGGTVTDTGVQATPDTGPACTPMGTALGSVDSFAVGSLTVVSRRRVVVARDDTGFAVFTAVCTHAGCVVSSRTTQLYCPCHSSYFDNNGVATRGPAVRSGDLEHYAASVCDGMVYFDDTQTVSPDTRTPPA